MTTCPRCKLTWGRSDEEHNTLFGVIGMAFENWPEHYEYQPNTTEKLRGWLAIQAHHSTVLALPQVRGMDRESAALIADMFTDGKEYFEVRAVGKGVEVIRPRTMKKAALHIREFRQMATLIYEIIETITGISPEVYKANKDRAA